MGKNNAGPTSRTDMVPSRAEPSQRYGSVRFGDSSPSRCLARLGMARLGSARDGSGQHQIDVELVDITELITSTPHHGQNWHSSMIEEHRKLIKSIVAHKTCSNPGEMTFCMLQTCQVT